jgi:CspA family cold shock protein
MISRGVVREWDRDQGFGVLNSEDTPGGCWVWFSSIVMDGYRELTVGAHISFTHETVAQDGYDYRAVLVWPPDVRPGTPPTPRVSEGPSAAYQSTLTIRWADGTVTERPGNDSSLLPRLRHP